MIANLFQSHVPLIMWLKCYESEFDNDNEKHHWEVTFFGYGERNAGKRDLLTSRFEHYYN